MLTELKAKTFSLVIYHLIAQNAQYVVCVPKGVI